MKPNKDQPTHDPDGIIYIGTKGYHADTVGNLFMDEDGRRVPKYMCLCFAHEANECVCGAWGYGLPEEYYL